MFLDPILKVRCVTDVEFSIKLTSQHINIIHICLSSGALNHVGFRPGHALHHMVQGHAPYVVHGGESGSRTHDPVISGIHDFQSCPFGLSGISP